MHFCALCYLLYLFFSNFRRGFYAVFPIACHILFDSIGKYDRISHLSKFPKTNQSQHIADSVEVWYDYYVAAPILARKSGRGDAGFA